MRNVDPFDALFNNTYGLDLTENVGDIIDKTIAVISDPSIRKRPKPKPDETIVRNEVRSGYAFVAMAIDDTKGELVDTLDAIKEAATRCGIQAERVDEEQSNDRITDRILKSIDAAEHVIVDLTLERPNVFYEAGYAQGKGKIPIYIARSGTKLHFDLKDYPIIFFSTYKQLKDDLEKRLRAVSSVKALSSGAEYDGAMPVEEPPPSLPPPATDR
ncbi:hypothetical protein MKL09_06395 [Methylobacterium sp. J-048]|uniref:hypothetical protein n=1 Tax=Methylobacterium sp. J-048 TaxID=2836635 RepID=UPI001FBA07DF|nr:hypothetical protein [Methylobacterium sp. J-048]MCJ2056175.1 hypothetical protein [Methylobacterium sp. J-048]